ncbi:glucose-1-phosphate cytidylyltransferase [soil metagenome]
MKVIILCGGQGTRLREETEYKPKPMVEIGGKPIIWHIMKLYSHYGYKDFVLALGYKGNVIRDYFLNYFNYNNDFSIELGTGKTTVYGSHDEHDWKVTLVETGADSMTGYRVKSCQKYITEDRFMLTYGDAVCNVNIEELVSFHIKSEKIGTVTGVYPPSRFGDLTIQGEQVLHFKEKSKDTGLQAPINGGFFVFKKEIFDLIDDDPKCDFERKPMDRLTEQNQLSIFKHSEFWQCMDTYRDYEYLNDLWKSKPEWKVWE